MTTTSFVSETVRELGDESSEPRKTSDDIQSDLQTLLGEFRRLASQVGNIVADKGGTAWQHARPSIQNVTSNAQETGREAVDAVREVTDNFVGAMDESVKNRPYTTLALCAIVGFILGATLRR